jgi:drug/metabolite transporter (DMT)-like permease
MDRSHPFPYPSNTSERWWAYLAILSNVIIWGVALPLVKPALNVISPHYFLFWRYLVACLFMVPVLIFTWPKKITFKEILMIIAIEFLQVGVSLTLLYQGLALTSALTASLMGSSAPIFVILGGIIFLHEREERHEWLGLLLSVAGTLVLVLSPLLVINHTSTSSTLGISLILGYLFANMAYLLLAKKFYHSLNKLFITALSCLVGLITYAIIAPLTGPFVPPTSLLASKYIILAILYMGILGSPIAVSLHLWGQSKIEASEASLFTYLQPLIYIPLSVLWLKDTLYPAQLIGLMVITIGVLIAQTRNFHFR